MEFGIEGIELWLAERDDLREILARSIGAHPDELRFEHGEFGKPRMLPIRGKSIAFNRSRAGGRELIATAPRELGVDLVDCAALNALGSPSCRELLIDHFGPFYSNTMSDTECVESFARLWTQSEAILKATGRGLNREGLPLACCALDAPLGEWRSVEHLGTQMRVKDFEIAPGFHAAVAVLE